jgi:choline dehydrogenase-like flavoprotein
VNTSSPYDVVVIGAGIVGSAIARELTGYDLSVALLDAQPDDRAGESTPGHVLKLDIWMRRIAVDIA